MRIVWARQLDHHIAQYANEVAAQYGVKAKTSYHSQGAFNHCYEVKIKEKLTMIFRFPILGKVAFPKEKVIDEVLIMKHIAKHTSIPTPKLLRVSDSSWGPCIVMELVEGALLSDSLKVAREPGKLEVLDPNINAQTLKKAYRGMARILIELSKCSSLILEEYLKTNQGIGALENGH